MAYQETLVALSDRTRRGLFERLRRGPMTVGALARGARISQPAVSQHLRVLQRARLVGPPRREGTRRYYRAEPAGLVELRKYLESMWDDVLAAYAAGEGSDPRRNDGRSRR